MKTTSTSSSPVAYLATGRDKNRLKIYGNQKVYLNNGQEFFFELHNPTQKTIGAKVFINGVAISQRMVVLRPGERDWLLRHIETDNKFVFNTYNVEDTNEAKAAISNNGVVRVEFYDEYVAPPVYTSNTFFVTNGNPIYGSNTTIGTGGALYRTTTDNTKGFASTPTSGVSGPLGASGALGVNDNEQRLFDAQNLNSVDMGDLNMCCADSVSSPSIETGRVEQGGATGQSFGAYYGTFNSWASASTEYQILPVSQQPVEASQMRQYCPGCRTRIRKQSWKFCPSCGEDLG